MLRITFVCTGNTCRSPMAKSIAAVLFKGATDVEFCSRGISVSVPERASESAVQALKNLDVLIVNDHISRQMKSEDILNSQLLVTMTKSQKSYLNSIYPGNSSKIITIYELADEDKDLEDPFGYDVLIYQNCAEKILSLLQKGLKARIIELRKTVKQ